MKQFRKMPGAFIAAAAVLLTGTATAQTDSGGAGGVARYTEWWLPGSASTSVAPIDGLFNLILWITSITFVLVFVLLIYFLFRYRYKENRRAIYSHGNNRLEIIWTILPAVIVLWLGIKSQTVWAEIKNEVPASPDLVIDVKPRQFQWDVSYVGADGKLGTPDDITTINQVYVPLGKTVLVNLTAQDVIHSFFIPEFRMKQDAVPGMVTRMWFTSTQTGKYEIACAELCGLGHGRMKGFLNIMEPAEYDKWYAEKQAEKAKQLAPPPAAAAPAGAAVDSSAAPAAADTTAARVGAADTTSQPSGAGTADTAARP